MKKQMFCGVALLALLIVPTSSHAATPDLQTLTQQLQTLTAQFESFKMRGGDRASSTRDTMASGTPRVRNASSSVDRTCMAAAVVAREDAIATAWSTFNTKMTEALAARKAGLVDAWNMTDAKARNQALMSVWKTAKSATKSAHDQLKSSRKGAWDTFKSTAKSSCKVEVPKEEGLDKASKDSIAL